MAERTEQEPVEIESHHKSLKTEVPRNLGFTREIIYPAFVYDENLFRFSEVTTNCPEFYLEYHRKTKV